MIFFTENSEYELDTADKKIRRLFGSVNPTQRQGRDGIWKSYDVITDVVVGSSVIIIYTNAEPLIPGSPIDAMPGVVTSRVLSIQQ